MTTAVRARRAPAQWAGVREHAQAFRARDYSVRARKREDADAVVGPLLRPRGKHLPRPGPVQLLRAIEERDPDVQRVCGKPRSTFEVAGSGQREVTTLPRVENWIPSGP